DGSAARVAVVSAWFPHSRYGGQPGRRAGLTTCRRLLADAHDTELTLAAPPLLRLTWRTSSETMLNSAWAPAAAPKSGAFPLVNDVSQARAPRGPLRTPSAWGNGVRAASQ